MDKTLSLPGTGASKTRKTLTGLAAAGNAFVAKKVYEALAGINGLTAQ